MGLFYPYASQNGLNSHKPQNDACLLSFADAAYMSDTHKVHFQTGYVFTIENTMTS